MKFSMQSVSNERSEIDTLYKLTYYTHMRLVELIENLSLDLPDINRQVVNREILRHYSNQDLVGLADVFLRGIGKDHHVNGHVVATLWGICDYWHEYHTLTPRQQVYLIQNILDNWSQISLTMRCQLCL